jgi:hypothetical protein
MKLYVCWTTGGGSMHPCGAAHDAVKAAGYEPEVVKAKGTKFLGSLNPTSGRKEVKELTGKHDVPVLVTDDGEAISGHKEIVAWAEAHPRTAAATAS